MSKLANVFLNIAKSIAESRGSGLAINIKEDGSVEYWYRNKNSDRRRVWENHYENVAFYLGNAAQPVHFEFDLDRVKNRKVVNALENATTTKYYQTFMQEEALERMFNVEGPKHDKMMTLMYVVVGGIGLLFIVMMAMYGGS